MPPSVLHWSVREFVARGRRLRKLFGGGMRQVGVIAAAALYAVDHHIDRLAEDHKNAQVIAQAIADTPGLRLDPGVVETNLVWAQVDPKLGTAAELEHVLKARGILIHELGPQVIRVTTHLDVTGAQALQAAEEIRNTCRERLKKEQKHHKDTKSTKKA